MQLSCWKVDALIPFSVVYDISSRNQTQPAHPQNTVKHEILLPMVIRGSSRVPLRYCEEVVVAEAAAKCLWRVAAEVVAKSCVE
jgi:hypothetical protein